MNQPTELNSELLSADARGRKHIPFAVFAVILIHIVLFVMLLIAAGCRSSARAKAGRPVPERSPEPHPAEKYLQAATNAAPAQPLVTTTEPVTEPVVPPEPQFAATAPAQDRAVATAAVPAPARAVRPRQTQSAPRFAALPASAKTTIARPQGVYVVQSGDTVEKIAKRHGTSIEAIKTANKLKGHTIFPGQKLVVKPGAASSTAQVKKSKSSNEV
jgi:LysM repeat protein